MYRQRSPFRFNHWLANLRVLDTDELKPAPYTPISHPFVERLIGTLCREYIDWILFWNAVALAHKLGEFSNYYKEHRAHRSIEGLTPAQRGGASSPTPASLDHHR